jgi:CheY-like chemotaxis protein
MDDEELIRDFTEELLKGLDYTVATCADGEEAYTLYRKFMNAGEPFSLVILDLSVSSGMGGVEAAQQILSFDPHARLIASSGNAHDPALIECEKFGFRSSIAKPYSAKELVQAITMALQNPLV